MIKLLEKIFHKKSQQLINNKIIMYHTIPDRNSFSLTGSEFGNTILNTPPNQTREDAILHECVSGNVPDFMREFVEISFTEKQNTIKYYVSKDVLCVGTDDDFLRVPMNPMTSQKICDIFNCVMPTRKISNKIWNVATVKLDPSPNGPPYDDTMQKTERFIFHNNKIEKQIAGRTGLITGHKKDIVISKQLLTNTKSVAIYGWFLPTGAPIQGLNATSHSNSYKDYSHSTRLISRVVIINDIQYDVYDVLNNVDLAYLISDEGSFDAKNMYR